MRAASWTGTPSIKGRSEVTRMILLTFSVIGLTITWGVETSYCTPYLLQLGMTKSRMSLVWIAGPLSGLIMQPIVGILADRSRSRYGRRRPFMIGGALAVAMCFLLLGWTSEIVGLFVQDAERKKSVTIIVAVFSIYAADFAINVVQASSRSLIVDTLPIAQQQLGSAWATRMNAVGQLFTYTIGSIDMVATFGTRFGDTQFKQMIVVAVLSMNVAVLITSYAVKERVLVAVRGADTKTGALQVMSQLYKTTMELPPRIQAICWVQFWSYIGYFPFMFYSTTWVGETYFRYEHPEAAFQSSDTLGDVGRLGSLSLVMFSIISFLTSVILPLGVRSPDDKSKLKPRPPPRLAAFLNRFMQYRPTLQTVWYTSHFVFAATMIFAPLARSVRFTTFLVAVCGIPLAISGWAPFTFMGIEINRLALEPPTTSRPTAAMITSTSFRTYGYQPVDSVDRDVEMDVLHLNHRNADDDSDNESASDAASTGELSGIYLGVLNVYTTLPQFVGTFISWIVFSILEPAVPKSEEGAPEAAGDGQWMNPNPDAPNAIALCLFIGALAALVAAEATRRFNALR